MKILQQISLTKSYQSRIELGAGDMDWMRGKILLKPENQLQLTEAVRLTSLLIFLLDNAISVIIVAGITRGICQSANYT